MLPSLKKQKDILEEKLKKYRKIAIVSHSENIRVYIGYKPDNCQIVPFTEEQLRELKIDWYSTNSLLYVILLKL